MIDNDAVIRRLPEIDGTAIKVYLAIARRADASGCCWPSVETIGGDAGIARRAVQLAIGRLVAIGLLAVEARPGMVKRYRVGGARSCAPADEGGAPECAGGAHDDAHGGAPSCAGGAHGGAPKQYPRTRPTDETHRTRPKRGCAAAVVVPAELDSDMFKEAWGRWTAHRKEIGKALTPSTTKAQLKKLATLGVTRAVIAIDHSIENGWTGLFEPSTNGNGQAKTPSEPMKYRA